MTLSTLKKQALVGALCQHPDTHQYWRRAFPNNDLSELNTLLSSPENKLCKEDLFVHDDKGRSFLDQNNFWVNFSKVCQVIAQNDEHFTRADFLRKINDGSWHTLLQSARQSKGYLHIFKEEAWAGHFDDMQDVFASFSFMEKKEIFPISQGSMDLNLKRSVLAAEGKVMPEDSLARAGLKNIDLHNAFRTNFGDGYEDIKERLAAVGDYFRKEYLLLPDDSGDTVFYFSSIWEEYNDIVDTLSQNGQRLEIKDFLREIGNSEPILKKAGDHRALDKVFNPHHWVDRLDDMIALWEHVPPKYKEKTMKQESFDLVYAAAESKTYKDLIDFSKIDSKIDLLSQINYCATPGQHPVYPIGIIDFWQHIDGLAERLAMNKESFSAADFRQKSGPNEETILIKGTKLGHFSKIVKLIGQNNEKLTVDDFLQKDKNGCSVLQIMSQRKELHQVFQPELWENRLPDMRALWMNVENIHRHQIDISDIEFKLKQKIIAARSNDNLRLPTRQKKI